MAKTTNKDRLREAPVASGRLFNEAAEVVNIADLVAAMTTGIARGAVVPVLDGATGDVTGPAIRYGAQSGIVHATIDTTGAKTCTISLYGSINADKSDPQLIFEFPMTTTATGTFTDFDFITAQWPYVYGVISDTAGAGTLDSADLDIAV